MLERLAAATKMSVTLDDAKAHLRVDHDAEDETITLLLQAAIDTCADESMRVFDPTPYRLSLGCWPACGFVDIPAAPVCSVNQVAYIGEDGDVTSVGTDDWTWIRTASGARVRLNPDYQLPTLGSDFQSDGRQLQITFMAGYLPPDEVQDDSPGELRLPSQARAAIMLTLGHLYANREAVIVGKSAVELPIGAKHLIHQIRIYR